MALKRTKRRLCVVPPKRDAAAGKGTCVTFTDKTKERLLVFPSKRVTWRPRWSPRCFPSLLASSAHRALSEPPAAQNVSPPPAAAELRSVPAVLCADPALPGTLEIRVRSRFPECPCARLSAERLLCAPFRKRSCSRVKGRSEVPSRRLPSAPLALLEAWSAP